VVEHHVVLDLIDSLIMLVDQCIYELLVQLLEEYLWVLDNDVSQYVEILFDVIDVYGYTLVN